MRRASLLVFAAAILSGFFYLPHLASHPRSDFSEEERIAIHLVHRQGYVSPYDPAASAPPTSWCPPVFPVLIAGVYKLLGVRTPAAILAILIANLIFRALAAVAILQLGNMLYGFPAGMIAAAIFLAVPAFWQSAALPWDNTLALAAFLWLTAAAFHLRAGRRFSALFPIALGGLLLANTAYVLTVPVLVLIAFRPATQRAAAAVLIGLTLVPWTVRNYAAFARLIPIRGNLAVELWIGNQPGSYGLVTRSNLDAHPSENIATRRQLLTLGEPAFFVLARQRFIAGFEAAPAAFFRRCANRLAYLFLDEPTRPDAWVQQVLCALAAGGLWGAGRMRLPWRTPLLLALLSIAPYIPTQAYDRYALPLRAILTIPAGLCLWRLMLAAARPRLAAPFALGYRRSTFEEVPDDAARSLDLPDRLVVADPSGPRR